MPGEDRMLYWDAVDRLREYIRKMPSTKEEVLAELKDDLDDSIDGM